MGLRLKSGITALFKCPNRPWEGVQSAETRRNIQIRYNHGRFQAVLPLNALMVLCPWSHSEKVTEAVVWEMKDEGLKEEIKRCPPPHLCTPGNSLCDVGVLFGDQKSYRNRRMQPPYRFWRLNGVGGRGRSTSAEAYLHLYESDVHLRHLIISQVLRNRRWQFIKYNMRLIYRYVFTSHLTQT